MTVAVAVPAAPPRTVVVALSLAVECVVKHAGGQEFAHTAGSFFLGMATYWLPSVPWIRERPVSVRKRLTLGLPFGLVMALTTWALARGLPLVVETNTHLEGTETLRVGEPFSLVVYNSCIADYNRMIWKLK